MPATTPRCAHRSPTTRAPGIVVYRFVRYAMAANRPARLHGLPQARIVRRPPRLRGAPTGAAGCSGKARGSVLNDLAHPAVEPLMRLVRAVGNERHRMLQFLRFEHLENGVWFARCNPSAAVVPPAHGLVQRPLQHPAVHHFRREPRHGRVYEGRDWYLVRTDEVNLPDKASDEKLMQAAWKRFYDTVAIEARYNPELRRQFMPQAPLEEHHRDARAHPRQRPSRTRGAIPKANGAARSPRPQYARRRRSGTSMLGAMLRHQQAASFQRRHSPAATLPDVSIPTACSMHQQVDDRRGIREHVNGGLTAQDGFLAEISRYVI